MWDSRKGKKADVLSHWYTLVENFSTSTKDFYAIIEQDLKERQVPDLKISRVTFSESGMFSADRLYLRMKREHLVFDICAAPFGTAYFFSMRFAELPSGISLGGIILSLLGALFFMGACVQQLGFILGGGAGLLSLIVVGIIVASTQQETYYRQDTRLMYLEVVNAVVKQRVAEVTSASGFHLLNIRQHSPILDELYKTTQVKIERVEPSCVPEPVAA